MNLEEALFSLIRRRNKHQCKIKYHGITYESKRDFSRKMKIIDNAVEAQESSIEIKQLKFQFMEKEVTYIFTVSNPYLYVSYAEIQSWFQIDKSSKGKHRGLGLYNVKELCEKYDANIVCRNKLDDSENWVEFTLEIAKTDK